MKEKGIVGKIKKKISKFSKIKEGDKIISVNKNYFRPLDVENLWGDSSKARKILKWKPKYSLDSLVKEMINLDIDEAYKEFRIKHLDAKE